MHPAAVAQAASSSSPQQPTNDTNNSNKMQEEERLQAGSRTSGSSAFRRSKRITRGTPIKLAPRRGSIIGRFVGRLVGKKEKPAVEQMQLQEPDAFASSITLDDFDAAKCADIMPFGERSESQRLDYSSSSILDSQPAQPRRRGSAFMPWDRLPSKPGRKESMAHNKIDSD